MYTRHLYINYYCIVLVVQSNLSSKITNQLHLTFTKPHFFTRIIFITQLVAASFGHAVTRNPKSVIPPGYSSALFMSSSAGGEDTVVSRCTQKIQDALNPSKLVVTGMHDDPNGSHIAVDIVSAEFEGKRSVMRQRMVYKAIWDEMQDGGAVSEYLYSDK